MPAPNCKCPEPQQAVTKVSGPNAKNPNEAFYTCPLGSKDYGGCGFFSFVNPALNKVFPSKFPAKRKAPPPTDSDGDEVSTIVPVQVTKSEELEDRKVALSLLAERLGRLESEFTGIRKDLKELLIGQEEQGKLIQEIWGGIQFPDK